MLLFPSKDGAAVLLALLVATGPSLTATHVLSDGALRVEIEVATVSMRRSSGPGSTARP